MYPVVAVHNINLCDVAEKHKFDYDDSVVENVDLLLTGLL